MEIRKGLLGWAFLIAAIPCAITGSVKKIEAEEDFRAAKELSWAGYDKAEQVLQDAKELAGDAWTVEQQKELDRATFRRVENIPAKSEERDAMLASSAKLYQVAQGLSFAAGGLLLGGLKKGRD